MFWNLSLVARHCIEPSIRWNNYMEALRINIEDTLKFLRITLCFKGHILNQLRCNENYNVSAWCTLDKSCSHLEFKTTLGNFTSWICTRIDTFLVLSTVNELKEYRTIELAAKTAAHASCHHLSIENEWNICTVNKIVEDVWYCMNRKRIFGESDL